VQGEVGPKLRVFGDGGYFTMKASHELGGGRVGTSDLGKQLQKTY